MEDRETARMRKYGESKTTRIMMATVPHVTSGLGLSKFQADGFVDASVHGVSILSVFHSLICRILTRRALRWDGHVARMNEISTACEQTSLCE